MRLESEKIISGLNKEFPDKDVVAIPPNRPQEIICEVEPSSLHPDHSMAIAFINKSEPHRHSKTTETYHVEEGELTLFVDDEKLILRKGDSYTVKPGQIHWAEGNFTRVKVNSSPGWSPKDHILVQEKEQKVRKSSH